MSGMSGKTVLERALSEMQTPFYVFDTDAAAAQVEDLRARLPRRVRLCYAVKANPFLIRDLEPVVDRFEVCSPGEFRICERVGIPLEKVVLSGVYKDPADLERIMGRYGGTLTYTAESPRQWELLAGCAGRHGLRVPVLLRLSNGSQFGMDPAEIKALLSAGNPGLSAVGIQYFTGTQKRSGSRIRRELDKLDQFLGELEAELGWRPELAEYGPGLPVRYFEGEDDPAPAAVEALRAGLEGMAYQGPVTLELGRYFAACAGYYATRIVDLKTNLGRRYCLVDGGIHQVNYYGQLLATKRPPVEVVPARAGAEEPYTVCGALCTTNDVLLKEFPLADPQIGDVLVFGRTGAYSCTEGIALFLSRDLPRVALYSARNGLRQVRDALPTDPWNGER